MGNDPFTIRIFVPDGDPQGIRTADRMNWTGMAIAFPREKWPDVCQKWNLDVTGVYILFGYSEDDDVPTIYIGEGDGIRDRIASHYQDKDFWSDGIAFISTNNGLNKAHVQWLEYALVQRAKAVDQCKLQNGNTPQEPALIDSEKADIGGFLREVFQILPLLGLRAFEMPKAVVAPKNEPSSTVPTRPSSELDTIVVPAQLDGFQRVFLGENCWYAVRISGGMLPKIRWVAGYQKMPVGAVTHVAPVDHIEPYGDGKKYKIVFSEAAKQVGPIPFGNAPLGMMLSSKYTTYLRLTKAKTLMDLFPDSVS